MILCPNGHENPDGATYCQVCQAYIDSNTAPPPKPTASAPAVKISIKPKRLTIDAGVEKQIEVTIESGEEKSDDFMIELSGVAWVEVDPWLLSLEPHAKGTAALKIKPPVSAAAEAVEFTVKVTPKNFPEAAANASCSVTVAAAAELEVRIEPAMAVGRREARFSLSVRNPAAQSATVTLEPVDEVDALTFTVDRQKLTIPPGGEQDSALLVTPKASLPRGSAPEDHRFRVDVASGSTKRASVTGTMRQTSPRLNKILIGAVATFAAILIALLVAALRPDPEPVAQPEKKVEVPNVIGMTATQAGNALQQAGLKYEIQLFDPAVANARVVATAPPAGSLVNPGDTITVVAQRGLFKLPLDFNIHVVATLPARPRVIIPDPQP